MRLRTPTNLLTCAALLGAVASYGCATGEEVTRETEKLETEVRAAKVPAYYCAPRDLALAEAHIDYARLESGYGDGLSAQHHLELARQHAQAVTAVKDKKGCCPDRDGDGLCDADDKCPDEPEDFDNDQDDDGCPEPDNDKDGVPDEKDSCPELAGSADHQGCVPHQRSVIGRARVAVELEDGVEKASFSNNLYSV